MLSGLAKFWRDLMTEDDGGTTYCPVRIFGSGLLSTHVAADSLAGHPARGLRPGGLRHGLSSPDRWSRRGHRSEGQDGRRSPDLRERVAEMFGLSSLWLSVIKYAIIALACMAIGAWGAVKIDSGRVATAQAATAVATANWKVATGNQATLQSGLDSCNAGVARAKLESDATAAKAASALAEAQAGRQSALAQIRKIQAAQISEVCPQGDALILESIVP